MKRLFYKFFGNIWRTFSGRRILLHVATILLTALIVKSGFDWFYFGATRSPLLQSLLFPAVVLLPMTALFLPLTLILVGKIKKRVGIENFGFALGQAAIIGVVLSSFYKSLTGRLPPPLHGFAGNTLSPDISHSFQFGLMEGGIFWGWPSGHTTVAFAVAVTAFVLLYQKNRTIGFIALLLALYVGVGISTNIHWFSDFIAGTLVGTAIGLSVGKSFK